MKFKFDTVTKTGAKSIGIRMVTNDPQQSRTLYLGKSPIPPKNTSINVQLALNASCGKRFVRRRRLLSVLPNRALPGLVLRSNLHTN